jgi:hypothetical protein
MDGGFISAIDSADVVVGAPTTLMLEAMLLERPCLIDLTTDLYHRTTASIAAKHFLHMQDLISVPDLHIGYSIDDVLTKVDELLAIESESMKYDISHLYKTNDSLYSEQLLAFLSAER